MIQWDTNIYDFLNKNIYTFLYLVNFSEYPRGQLSLNSKFLAPCTHSLIMHSIFRYPIRTQTVILPLTPTSHGITFLRSTFIHVYFNQHKQSFIHYTQSPSSPAHLPHQVNASKCAAMLIIQITNILCCVVHISLLWCLEL